MPLGGALLHGEAWRRQVPRPLSGGASRPPTCCEEPEEGAAAARDDGPQAAQVAAGPPETADRVRVTKNVATGDAALHGESSEVPGTVRGGPPQRSDAMDTRAAPVRMGGTGCGRGRLAGLQPRVAGATSSRRRSWSRRRTKGRAPGNAGSLRALERGSSTPR